MPDSSSPSAVTAVIPLKALDRAKGRLATELGPAQRRELARWMFARTLAACRASRAIGAVLAVVGDDEGAALAAARGARVLREPAAGLATALAAADDAVGDAPASLVVAADLPLVTGDDLDRVCGAGGDGPVVVVAPTRDGGTGALLRRPAGVVGTAYGPGSARAHVALAAAAGVRAVVLDVPALALDVDTPGSLREAAAAWGAGVGVGKGGGRGEMPDYPSR